MRNYTCPACGGDGQETCNNHDHGFIRGMSFHDVGRIGCPCCGHDEDHKVYTFKEGKRVKSPCYECDAT